MKKDWDSQKKQDSFRWSSLECRTWGKDWGADPSFRRWSPLRWKQGRKGEVCGAKNDVKQCGSIHYSVCHGFFRSHGETAVHLKDILLRAQKFPGKFSKNHHPSCLEGRKEGEFIFPAPSCFPFPIAQILLCGELTHTCCFIHTLMPLRKTNLSRSRGASWCRQPWHVGYETMPVQASS